MLLKNIKADCFESSMAITMPLVADGSKIFPSKFQGAFTCC